MAFPARNPRSFRWLVGPDMLRPCGPLILSTTRLTWLPGLPWLKMAMPCPMRLRASILQGFGLGGVIIRMHIIIIRSGNYVRELRSPNPSLKGIHKAHRLRFAPNPSLKGDTQDTSAAFRPDPLLKWGYTRHIFAPPPTLNKPISRG